MDLLIYACCKESDRLYLDESSVRIEWAESTPALNDIISMGRQKRWVVVEIAAYKPVNLGQAVQAVYLVYVQREDLPLAPKVDWSFFHPQENIHVFLSAIAEPELQLGFNIMGDPPRLGERLLAQEIAPYPRQIRSVPREWVVDRYDTYLPEHQTAYSAIYLIWCVV
jgi:hypothetical protein